MMKGHNAVFDCIKDSSETDFTSDLGRFDIPTLILHGDDDLIVPIGSSALLSAKLVPGGRSARDAGRAARNGRDPQEPR
jgi:non-heme chloroperoxidase